MVVSGVVERSAVDRMILRFSRSKSANEIAELTGLSPVVVAERRERLLADRDVLSHRQRELLMLVEAEEMLVEFRDRLSNAKERNYSGLLNAGRQLMAFIREIGADRRAAEDEIGRITAAHARLFGRAFDVALGVVAEGLVDEYGVDESVLDGLVAEGLRRAQAELGGEVVEG